MPKPMQRQTHHEDAIDNTASQEETLLKLVQGNKGKDWAADREGWQKDSKYSACFWDGIICDTKNVHVTGIFLPNALFYGTIPTELGFLTNLQTFSAPENVFTGTIPSELSTLPRLEKLDLETNALTGTFPTILSSELEELNLANNDLRGSLPMDIGSRSSKMISFDVTTNKLSGPIPPSFSLMHSLSLLGLTGNSFSGTIPSILGSIKSLEYLYLDHNNLMGTIPAKIARPSSSMKEFWLHDNMLSGTIPNSVSDMEDLYDFYIDGNKFTGTIPTGLCRADINADFFEDMPGNETRNLCDSIACPAGEVSTDGLYPCVICKIKYVNPYLGRVGQCIDLVQADIINSLNDALGGVLTPLPVHEDTVCEVDGITCDAHDNVLTIDLKSRGLRGTIPPELGFLPFLQELDLSDNLLTGYIPTDLRFAPLELLDITGNLLVGIVPKSLCQKGGINGNGDNGKLSCDSIVCPRGTHSPRGRAFLIDGGDRCTPCDTTTFLGSRHCDDGGPLLTSALGSHHIPGASLFPFVMFCLGVVLAIYVIVLAALTTRKRCIQRSKGEQLPQEDQSSFLTSQDMDSIFPSRMSFFSIT